MQHFKKLKHNDTGAPITVLIRNASDSLPQDLDGVTAKFRMYKIEDDGTKTELINSDAVIEDPPSSGRIRYDWVAGDTDEVGTHYASFRLTYTNNNNIQETYPRCGWINIKVCADFEDL